MEIIEAIHHHLKERHPNSVIQNHNNIIWITHRPTGTDYEVTISNGELIIDDYLDHTTSRIDLTSPNLQQFLEDNTK